MPDSERGLLSYLDEIGLLSVRRAHSCLERLRDRRFDRVEIHHDATNTSRIYEGGETICDEALAFLAGWIECGMGSALLTVDVTINDETMSAQAEGLNTVIAAA